MGTVEDDAEVTVDRKTEEKLAEELSKVVEELRLAPPEASITNSGVTNSLAGEPPPEEPKSAEPPVERAEKLNAEQAQPLQAERLAREELRKRPPPTTDEIIDASQFNALTKDWLRRHSEFLTSAEGNAALNRAHVIAEYNAGEVHTPRYFSELAPLFTGPATSVIQKMTALAFPA
jgi:hypothetical protein